jgi:hypothetical protein
MATRIYLHVGAPKSGTTYLQSILWNNRAELRERGVLYPGGHPLSHTHAALDLQNQRFDGYEDPAIPGAWKRLADEVASFDGVAIVSQELFSPALPEQIEHALDSLGTAEIHLVYTARDLARQVPAAWQEDLKNRSSLAFGEFVAGLRASPEEVHPLVRGFWRMQDAADVLGRWARGVPADRVHLVTIPRRHDPGVLWTRFCEAAGLDPGAYDTADAAVNGSLGVTEANLLRRLNLALGDELSWPHYNRFVTGLLGIDVLAARQGTARIALPAPDRAWIRERAIAMLDELRAAGYDVVGDLDELVPAAEGGPVAEACDAGMLEAALHGMVALLSRLGREREELDRLEREHGVLRAEAGFLRERLEIVQAERDRVHAEAEELHAMLAKPATKLFVRRLSEKHRSVMRARIIYWNIVEWLRR